VILIGGSKRKVQLPAVPCQHVAQVAVAVAQLEPVPERIKAGTVAPLAIPPVITMLLT
jgi:hypothetical protein